MSSGAGPDDALGWWAFDDGAGSTAADGSGHGNTATVAGATWTTGRFGGALAFDGVNDHVVVPRSASLDQVTDRHDLAFWLRGDVLTQDWVTAMQRTSATGAWFDWQLYARAAGRPDGEPPGLPGGLGPGCRDRRRRAGRRRHRALAQHLVLHRLHL